MTGGEVDRSDELDRRSPRTKRGPAFPVVGARRAVIARDSPVGVGHVTWDRIGMMVGAGGFGLLLLSDDEIKGLECLVSDGKGGEGSRVLGWDGAARNVCTRIVAFDDEFVRTTGRGD